MNNYQIKKQTNKSVAQKRKRTRRAIRKEAARFKVHRCPECGLRVRGPGHSEGPQHKARIVKIKELNH